MKVSHVNGGEEITKDHAIHTIKIRFQLYSIQKNRKYKIPDQQTCFVSVSCFSVVASTTDCSTTLSVQLELAEGRGICMRQILP